MDSFYDQPRNAPKPTNVDQLTGPVIPEISIIQPPIANARRPVRPDVESYNVWKARNVPDRPRADKENFNQRCTSGGQFGDPCPRKHVRFESPALNSGGSSPFQGPSLPNANVGMRPLEEIYMANIPNRNLDLSILDVPLNKKGDTNCYDIFNYRRGPGSALQTREEQIKEVKAPQDVRYIKTYADFKKQLGDNEQLQLNPAGNYKKETNIDLCKGDNYISNDNFVAKEPLYSRNLCDKLIKHDWDPDRYQHVCYSRKDDYTPYDLQLMAKRRNDDEPTTRDLFKVIQQQNEQILLLQKQVACLLETKANQRQIEEGNRDPSVANTPTDSEKYKRPKKGPLSKIAIDVMTSFEVSFRPQNQNPQRNRLREIDDSPRIEEINDGAGNVLDGIRKDERFDDVSMSLREPLEVVERCPSPEQSIHVEMQDYSSDEEDTNSDLGWTVYNNIMGQVNNIFKNAQSERQSDTAQYNSDAAKDKTSKRVREATMRHLKNIGVNLPLIEENDVSKDSKRNDESDVSFVVKQLLMKYLPDEQLAKLTNNKAKQMPSNENLIKTRPEFSFATIQYMKKYNLLSSDGTRGQLPARPQTNSPKILDVTALKQQPKLL